MLNRIPILLDERTAAGLIALAKQEYRDPRAQAALIIRQELERRGFLKPEMSLIQAPGRETENMSACDTAVLTSAGRQPRKRKSQSGDVSEV